MPVAQYLDLNRKFIERTEYNPDELLAAEMRGKSVGWDRVLERRASVIVAPANYGKTTEMEEQAKRLRGEGQPVVFVPLRRVRARGGLEAALLDAPQDLGKV